MESRTEGRRGRGRPRKAYVDKIEDIARKTGKGIGDEADGQKQERLEEVDRGSRDAVRQKRKMKKKKKKKKKIILRPCKINLLI